MSPRLGFFLVDILLSVLVLRLMVTKRAIDRYRPPSPLPAAKATVTWESLTIVRVS